MLLVVLLIVLLLEVVLLVIFVLLLLLVVLILSSFFIFGINFISLFDNKLSQLLRINKLLRFSFLKSYYCYY